MVMNWRLLLAGIPTATAESNETRVVGRGSGGSPLDGAEFHRVGPLALNHTCKTGPLAVGSHRNTRIHVG